MRTKISGRQIEIGAALQTHVKDSLTAAAEKYAGRPTDANVIFSKSGAEFVCEANIHLSTGLTCAARASAHEIYAAFDLACDKMEKQLRRNKRRLKDHHRNRERPVEVSEGSSYILAASETDDDAEDTTESLQPVIVAEMGTRIPSLSVGEAVMQMELDGAPLLVFRNEGQDRVNVVYRRDDGNVGWIDPGTN